MVGLIKLLFLSCRTYKQIYTFIEFINEICVNFYIGIEYYEFHIGIDQVLLVDIFMSCLDLFISCMESYFEIRFLTILLYYYH